jgi:hypothetical protein
MWFTGTIWVGKIDMSGKSTLYGMPGNLMGPITRNQDGNFYAGAQFTNKGVFKGNGVFKITPYGKTTSLPLPGNLGHITSMV